MRFGLAILLLVVLGRLDATSCGYPPPCARLGPKAIYFVGEVISEGKAVQEAGAFSEEPGYEYRLRVIERFTGLDPYVKEVTAILGRWPKSGELILVDAFRSSSGSLETGVCGMTGPVASQFVAPMVEFLRGMKQRGPQGSISIHVGDQRVRGDHRTPIEDALVILEGPVRREGATKKGRAVFENLPPGSYHVQALKPGYVVFDSPGSARIVESFPQSCPSGYVWLEANLNVGGIVMDGEGRPVSDVLLQLWEQTRPPMTQIFETKSSADGRFRFAKVKPGIFHLLTGDRRRKSYFPGRASAAETTPLEVLAGTPLENLNFVLLDSGSERTIRVRAVDSTGKPVSGATIRDFSHDDDFVQRGSFSSLAKPLTTNTDGVVVVKGFEGAHYRIYAIHGKAFTDTGISKYADIPPGKSEIEVVLTVQPSRPGGIRR